MQNQDENKKEENKPKKTGRSHPAIAVIGFFAIMFIGAYFAHLFRRLWIIPVGIILMIAWAVYFSMPKEK